MLLLDGIFKRRVETVEVLVPILDIDPRNYAEKWNDDDYVQSVIALGGLRAFNSEAFEALKEMRLGADKAETPEELKGYRRCIEIMRAFITAPERGRRRIQIGEELERLNGEN